MAWLVLVQVRSEIREQDRRVIHDTLRGLGLGKVWRVSVLEDTRETYGLLERVKHMVLPLDCRPGRPTLDELKAYQRQAQRTGCRTMRAKVTVSFDN